MVKVQVTKPYKDMKKMVLFEKGETHEVTEERAKELVAAGVVKIVTKTTQEETK